MKVTVLIENTARASSLAAEHGLSLYIETGGLRLLFDTGATGAAGADAITMAITTNNGTVFKNSNGSTTLTAHVYKAGAELSSQQIAQLGTIKWYKDGGTTSVGSGATLSVSASSVSSKAVYTAKLED